MIRDFLKKHTLGLRALLLPLIFIVFLNACEKDDICVEGDTPLLIIRFYDAEDPESIKPVNNLRILGLDQANPPNTFTDRGTLDSIAIPLRINQPDTGFLFISDSAEEDGLETGNIDTLTFGYNTQEVFVSRACGFIANYTDLSETLTTDADNWIQSIVVVSPSVNSLNSAHVEIYH